MHAEITELPDTSPAAAVLAGKDGSPSRGLQMVTATIAVIVLWTGAAVIGHNVLAGSSECTGHYSGPEQTC